MTPARAERQKQDDPESASERISERASERTCALTRQPADPASLLRFVEGPDGDIVPDLKRKLPGRGVWITATRASVVEAVKRNVFARSLKRPVKPSPDLADLVETLLTGEARQSLAMANKARLVVTGAFQVEKQIGKGRIAALVHAQDGSPDGKRKIAQALYRNAPDTAPGIPRIEIFDSNQLDLALGHTNVIHAALRQGAASDAFVARSRRLAFYRTGKPENEANSASEDLQDGVSEEPQSRG